MGSKGKHPVLRQVALSIGAAAALFMAALPVQAMEDGFVPVVGKTSAPIGYIQFCRDNPADCGQATDDPRDIVLTKRAMRDLRAVNDAVNNAIDPVTDEDQYGTVEFWTYPTTGRGDCEEYVLAKRKMLIDAGWPASALLITVVRDRKGDGHAVLTVKTDRGELILDNQETRILPWSETGLRFVKRQSQSDPNLWVSLGDTPTSLTAGN